MPVINVSLVIEIETVASPTVVKRVPEVGDTTTVLSTLHSEAVLERSEVTLGGRAGVVSEVRGLRGRVGLVVVEIGSELVVRTVKLGTSSLVVTGQDHVGDLGGDVVHPLLPQVPVGLVDHGDVTTLRTTLVGHLARGKRDQVLALC